MKEKSIFFTYYFSYFLYVIREKQFIEWNFDGKWHYIENYFFFFWLKKAKLHMNNCCHFHIDENVMKTEKTHMSRTAFALSVFIWNSVFRIIRHGIGMQWQSQLQFYHLKLLFELLNLSNTRIEQSIITINCQ